MKKRFLAAVCAAALAASLCGGAASAAEGGAGESYALRDYENGQALVFYTDGSWELIDRGSRAALLPALTALALDPAVDFVQPNLTYEAVRDDILIDDPMFTSQWALYNDGSFSAGSASDPSGGESALYGQLYGDEYYFHTHDPFTGAPADAALHGALAGADIGAGRAMELYAPVRSVTVAIIDTGVEMAHEDLGDVFWVNSGEIPGNGLDDDGNGYADDVNGWNFCTGTGDVYSGEEDSHGTHCAGTIAAATGNGIGVAGLAGDGSVRLMPLKVLGGKSGLGTTASVIEAIEYAQAGGARIVNMSFATDRYDRALLRAISGSSMLFVVAAGNSGADISSGGSFPSGYDLPNVISAAAVSSSGLLYKNSNYSASAVDVAAPGDYIVGLYADSGYAYMSGTSMAAPMVTAAAAMLYCQSASLQVTELKDIILSTAAPMASLSGACVSEGLLDIGAAMEYVTARENARFSDISGHWAEAYINEAASLGLFGGTGDKTFSPDAPMTRAMLVSVLYRMAGSPAPESAAPFSDVPAGAYYAAAAAWAAEKGLVSGTGGGRFSPEDPVSREQTAALLYRWAGLSGRDVSAAGSLSAFTDGDAISPWAAEAVAWAVGAGLMTGRPGGALDPSGGATRAELSALLARFSS